MTSATNTLSLRTTAALCGAFALALYTLTLAPTFGWGDSADLAMRMVSNTDTTFVGTTRDYALYRMVGTLFQHIPIGDAGTRANFMTAYFGALTVALIAMLTGYLTRSRFAACAAALSLTVSHTFWLMSVIAEVYTFNATLIFACYLAMAIWWREQKPLALVAAALFAGLALTHHASGLLVAATLAPLLLARLRRTPLPLILAALITYAIASFPYWQHVFGQLEAHKPFLKALGLASPSNPFFDTAPLRELIKFAAFACYNFLGASILLALWGVVVAWKNRTAELLPPALWFLLMLIGGITASIPDKFNIYVLIYPVLAIAIGIGAAQLRPRFINSPRRAALLLLALAIIPPLGYRTAIITARHMQIDLVGARTAPYRDNDIYFMWPGKHGDRGPRRFATEALDSTAPNAILIADYTLWRPLYFLQTVEAIRPDIHVVWSEPLTWYGSIASYISAQPCSTPIYLASDTPPAYYQLDELKKHFDIVKTGILFQVKRRCKP